MCKPSITISKLPKHFPSLVSLLLSHFPPSARGPFFRCNYSKKERKWTWRKSKYFRFPVALHLCNNSFQLLLLNLTEKKGTEQAIRIIITEKSVINFQRQSWQGKSRKSESNCCCNSSGRFRMMRRSFAAKMSSQLCTCIRRSLLTSQLSWLIIGGIVICLRGGSTNEWIIKMRFENHFMLRDLLLGKQQKQMFPDSSQNIATT